tara:strand:- start:5678 stop:5926 length:249 start_codon:yes stop_codon:yes gene_type:complete
MLPVVEGVDETCSLQNDPLIISKQNVIEINNINKKLARFEELDFDLLKEDVENNKVGLQDINEKLIREGVQPGDEIIEVTGI